MALIKTLSEVSSTILTSDRRNIYIEPTTVAELWPEVTPFTTDLYAGKLKRVTDPVFKMFEYRNMLHDAEMVLVLTPDEVGDNTNPISTTNLNNSPVGGNFTVALAADDLVSAIYFDNTLKALTDTSMIGYMFEVWGGATTVGTLKHIVRIKSVVADTSITFTKVYDGADLAIPVESTEVTFRLIGNSVGEGSYARDSWFNDITTVWGATQKFNTTVEVTDDFIEGGIVLRGFENEFNRLVKDKAKEHKLLVERTLLYGASAFSIGAGTTGINDPKILDNAQTPNYVRTSKGLINEILAANKISGQYQNIFKIETSGNNIYDYPKFVKDSEKIFQFAPQGYKKAYCGPGIMSYWAQIAMNGFFGGSSGVRNSITLSDMEKNKAGYNMKYLETPHGVLELVYTPALRGKYSNCMVIPSQEDLMLAEFKPLRYNTNIKTDNGYKGRKDEYYEEVGLGMNLIEKHAIMYLA